jgi:hypothetical protein
MLFFKIIIFQWKLEAIHKILYCEIPFVEAIHKILYCEIPFVEAIHKILYCEIPFVKDPSIHNEPFTLHMECTSIAAWSQGHQTSRSSKLRYHHIGRIN